MFKYFIFTIILFFNVNVLSQIIIKDEIVLDEINTSVYTPEYGQVRIWLKIHPTDPFTKAVIRVGEFTHLHGENFTCPCTGCSSIGEYILVIRDNVPAQTEVSIEVSRCVDGEWTDCPVTYGGWNYNPPVYYEMEYNVAYGWDEEILLNSDEPDEIEDIIRVYPTTASGCNSCTELSDEACEECLDPTNLLPEINLVQVPKGTDGLDPCAEDPTNQAGFKISTNGLLNIDYVLNACYNTQLQRWWFTIEGNSLNFKYVLEYCDQNIARMGATLIDDYENFPSTYGCDLIFRDLEVHFKYGRKPYNGGFVLKSMLEAHELQHYLDFANVLEVEKEILFLELLEEAPLCEEFSSVQEATNYWRVNPDKFSTLLYKFWDRAAQERQNYTNHWYYERNTHRKIRRTLTQIQTNALCYWNCAHLLPTIVTCP